MFGRVSVNNRTGCFRAVTVSLALLVVLATAGPIGAQSALEQSSLKFVPEDAAFYGAAFRLREQYDALVSSNAFKKLSEMPLVQMGLARAKAEWDNPEREELIGLKEVLGQTENKELIALVIDAVSHEMFCYGSSDFAEFLAIVNEINGAMNAAQFQALTSGREPGEVIPEKLLELLGQKLQTVSVPDFVLGLKLTNADRAGVQMKRLEVLLGALLEQQPALKDRLERKNIRGSEFLTLSLDGSLVPWDQLPLDQLDVDEAQRDVLIGKLKSMTFAIGLGVYDGYLIFSIGDNVDHLSRLGQGGLLANRPELAPLREHATKPITSVGFVSGTFMQRAASVDRQLDDMVSMAKGLLPLAPLDDQMKQEISRDVEELVQDVKRYIPVPGPKMSFEYRSAQGYEGYQYNWTKSTSLDGSQPLTILDHVGGNPLVMLAMRGKYSPEQYQLMSKWLVKGFSYAERIVMEQAEEEDRQFYGRLRQQLLPLVARLDKANREMLIPAFADGQAALVLDAKLANKQWHLLMPPSETPLPMLELGIVYGVRDPDLLKRGVTEYFQVAQTALAELHTIAPDEVPEIKLPAPESRQMAGGSLYFYPLPAALGIDQTIAPNAGLSDKFMALSLTLQTTERLLGNTALAAGGPLSGGQRPLAAAVHCDFAGTIEAIKPWIDYALKLRAAMGEEDAQQLEMWRGQIQIALDVLQCFRGMTSATSIQDDAAVTHSEWRFADL
jgi:hypothetical protein